MESNLSFPQKIKPFFESPKRYNVLEGGRGGGKSWTICEFLLMAGMMESKRILCTREVQRSIADSVHKLLADKIKEHGYPYDVTHNTIKSRTTETEFIFAGLKDHNVATIKSLEGVDICWVEEAQMISRQSLEILIPTIRREGSFFIFTMNRFEELDPVYERFCLREDPDICHIHINYYDNPFCPEELVKEAARCKEFSYEDYIHIWEGEPIQQGDTCILSIAEVRQAMERHIEPEGALEVGADIARFGDDRTVMYKRHGLKVIRSEAYKHQDIKITADRIKVFAGEAKVIKVDDTGLGGGVTDNLKHSLKRGWNVIPINFAQAPKDKDKYPDLISEMYFEFKSKIHELDLPDDHELLTELCSRRYKFDNKGRRQVEPKAEYKKRYTKSPDKADAVLLCFYEKYKGFDANKFKFGKTLESINWA